MKKLIASISIFTLFNASPVLAMDNMSQSDMDQRKITVGKEFKMMDTNDDGKVTKAEYMACMEKMFNDGNANHDGMLSKEEMMDMKKIKMEDMSMTKGGMIDNK
ncbi:MAG: hypothetical protein K2Q01_03805 [Rickettsiales bacterium]|nr:hypothetical protein [Rickettsiales bacterium]